MRHFNKERIKSIAIAGLLITSLIQVGILWGYQSHGAPTSFFTWFFGKSSQQMTSAEARDKLFMPSRLILSSGYGSHWVISREDDLFKQVNEEAKGYLKSIVEGKLTRTVPEGNWGTISKKQGFLLEFGYDISPELLRWFTGASKAGGETPSVCKMLINPDLVNESLCKVYIIDSEDNISAYSVNNISRQQTMEDIFSIYDGKSKVYRNYDFMSDGNLDRYSNQYPFEPDVLYATKSPQYWPYSKLQVSIPAKVLKENELADILLENEKDRYIKSPSKDYLQFSNTESMYRVYDDGSLSYKLLNENNSSDKGDVGGALKNAYSFVTRLGRLTNGKAEICLTGIDYGEQGFYSFSFDYRFDGLPVALDLRPKCADTGALPYTSAIKVDANGSKVLSCSSILREFNQGQKLSCNDRFFEVMPYYGVKYMQMKITDIFAGYYLNQDSANTLEPSLVIRLKGDPAQAYGMIPQKGG